MRALPHDKNVMGKRFAVNNQEFLKLNRRMPV
ncbi:hypothetical protein HCH_01567 [Hahella chejuensis KCTC 2396]|uniref:Uncharacterized protein n=1 Tax=Hahella chejuensis (strain KCTC 2396) TaxID=349521 RepID=Q2SLQ0_HAHCH|nr:hypothetical protein HCH_01567 [Hahella chejuensis KCTC 2396]